MPLLLYLRLCYVKKSPQSKTRKYVLFLCDIMYTVSIIAHARIRRKFHIEFLKAHTSGTKIASETSSYLYDSVISYIVVFSGGILCNSS